MYWRGGGAEKVGRFTNGACGRVETEQCIWLLRG